MGKVMLDFISTYKFYLAFENTHKCKDYITEKLHKNSFKSGAVPIVYGARKVNINFYFLTFVTLSLKKESCKCAYEFRQIIILALKI